jgi:hypothetical protein
MEKEQFNLLTGPELSSLCRRDWMTAVWALMNSAHCYQLVDVVS